MFKKIILATLLSTSIAAASISNAAGAYVGAGVGAVANTSSDYNYRGMPMSAFAGYGASLGNGAYLAGEVGTVFATAPLTNNGLKTTYGYALGIIPGIMLSDHTMGYARIGVARTHFTPSGGARIGMVTGTQAGLGMQTSLMQGWDVRGEYIYTAYHAVSGLSGNPHSDAFNLGLVYKFE